MLKDGREVVAEFVDLKEMGAYIVLIDDDGKKGDFFLLAWMGIEENNYIIVIPPEEYKEADEEEVVIFKMFNSLDGEERFIEIEDEEEWDIAAQAWERYVEQHIKYN